MAWHFSQPLCIAAISATYIPDRLLVSAGQLPDLILEKNHHPGVGLVDIGWKNMLL
jgi:hypothetical protein